MNVTGFVLAIVATIGFAGATIYNTKVTRKVGAIHSLFLYQLIGIPLFLFLIPIMPPIRSTFSILPLLALGAFDGLSYLLFMNATKSGDVSVLGTVMQFYMVVTTILGILFLHESASFSKIIAVFFIFGGLVLFGLQINARKLRSITILRGVPETFLSSVGVGIYLFFVATQSRASGWFLTALIIRLAISATMLVLMIIRKENLQQLFHHVPWRDVSIAAICDVTAFSVYSFAVSKYEVSTITMIVATQPVVIMLLARKIFGERLSRHQIVGFLVILAGFISLQLK